MEQAQEQQSSVAEEYQEEQEHNKASGQPSKMAHYWTKLKSFWIECKRVLLVTKKPDKEEFRTIVKVSGLGILIIGFIGFIIHFFKEIFL